MPDARSPRFTRWSKDMARLAGRGGPWDHEQTAESLSPTLEEVDEVLEAIDGGGRRRNRESSRPVLQIRIPSQTRGRAFFSSFFGASRPDVLRDFDSWSAGTPRLRDVKVRAPTKVRNWTRSRRGPARRGKGDDLSRAAKALPNCERPKLGEGGAPSPRLGTPPGSSTRSRGAAELAGASRPATRRRRRELAIPDNARESRAPLGVSAEIALAGQRPLRRRVRRPRP